MINEIDYRFIKYNININVGKYEFDITGLIHDTGNS